MSNRIGRRTVVGGAVGAVLGSWLRPSLAAVTQATAGNGRFTQSVCRWPFAKIPLRDFCQSVAGMGLTAIDLLTPDEWPVAKEFGLTCSIGSGLGGTIVDGLNDPAHHDAIVNGLTDGIPRAAAVGVPSVTASRCASSCSTARSTTRTTRAIAPLTAWRSCGGSTPRA